MIDALVGAGGGVRGAFCMGCLDGPIRVKHPDLDPKILTCVSIGSMLVYLMQASPGRFWDYVSKYVDLWMKIEGNQDVWKARPVRMVARLIWKLLFKNDMRFRPELLALRDTTTMQELFDRHIHLDKLRNSGRRVEVAAVDLCTQELVFGNERDPMITSWMRGSSSPPIFFPPVPVGERLLVDAALRETVAINKALEMGATRIILLLTGPKDEVIKRRKEDFQTVLDTMERSLEAMLAEVRVGDFHTHDASVTIEVYAPEKPLISGGAGDALNFYPETIREFYQLGLQAKPMSLGEFMEC